MYKIIFFVAIVLGGYYLTKKYFSEILKGRNIKYKYFRKNYLITPAEHELFDILVKAVGNEYYVFPQVHLDCILNNKVYGQNWSAARKSINQKSVDFLICDKNNIKPLLAIELDDRSHQKAERAPRDQMVDQIFNDSDMPLLRIINHGPGSFNCDEIKNSINSKLLYEQH